VHADEPVTFTDIEKQRIFHHSPVPDPPEDPTNRYEKDPRAARLGQFLFFDTRLSSNGKIACATCHDPARGFADGKPVFEGLRRGKRNTLSLWNVAYNRWYFWDGRADSLWAQAATPIEHPDEMGFSRVEAARLVAGDLDLRRAYESIFGDLPDLAKLPRRARPVADDPRHADDVAWRAMSDADRSAVNRVFVNLAKAIAAYQRQLISRRAPFDEFVTGLCDGDVGKKKAISPAAQRGLKLFVGRANCRLCHSGSLFTDGEFHNTGVPPPPGREADDPGRFRGIDVLLAGEFNAATAFSDAPDGSKGRRLRRFRANVDDWGAFKTPSLRNVALTAPYMHQGQLATLGDVIRYYSTLEGAVRPSHHRETVLSPLGLSVDEVNDLTAFLESLTGDSIPQSLRKPPPSPIMENPAAMAEDAR